MLSTRLNSDLKPSFMLFIGTSMGCEWSWRQKNLFSLDENPSSSALAFQVAYAFTSEVANRFSNVFVLLNEPVRKFRCDPKFQLIDLFHNEGQFNEIPLKSEEKSLILIECLSWLIVDHSESVLIRRLHEWSSEIDVAASSFPHPFV